MIGNFPAPQSQDVIKDAISSWPAKDVKACFVHKLAKGLCRKKKCMIAVPETIPFRPV
jgi:hypothetical protein